MKDQLQEKYEQVKTHVRQRRAIYISAGAGVVVGAAGALVWAHQNPPIQKISGLFVWKPSQMIVSMTHPGWAIRDENTGTIYPSKHETARALSINRSNLADLLEGETRQFGDHVLTNTGTASFN